ncbi:MAG TPA: hypothetical protein PLZ43_08290 [bacterium]|nr:hypothetical protein [bacterium]
MNEKNQISETFWEELEEVYKLDILGKGTFDKNGQNKIPESFWNELQELYQLEEQNGVFGYNPENEPEDSVFEELEKFFDLINTKAIAIIKENPESPLLYPFSLFRPMNRERDEVHYTKTLAWFMNHNPEILKEILMLFKFNDDNLNKYHAEAEVWDNEQKNRLDIAVMAGDQIIVAIEAKIDSEEGKRISKENGEETFQLEDYDEWLQVCHPKCEKEKNRIFLVVDKDIEISSDNWKIFTWKEVAITLLRFLEKNHLSHPEHHYLSFFVASIIQDIYEIEPNNNFAIANLINMTREK